MAHLSVRVLGSLQVALDGEPVTGFVSDEARALLAYLAVEADRPHRREALSGLLCFDVPEDSARTSLRTALASVRHAVGDHAANPPYLDTTRQTVQFNRHSDALVDASEFTHLLEATLPHSTGEPADPSSIQYLEAAIALYRGGFLAGFSPPGSVLFEEWALLRREQLQRQAMTALRRLAAHYETSWEPRRALQHAWRAVDLDPWPGGGQRQLMRLLALIGQREAALAQYNAYRQLLAEELGIEPSEATRELYESLSGGEWPADTPVPALVLERELVAAEPCPYRGLAAFREQDAPFFFGREGFVARLAAAVRQKSMAAVIVGSSGCGKSSTIFAGLLPRLREAEWLIADFRPGRRPFHAQTAALQPLMGPGSEAMPASAPEGHAGDGLGAVEFSLQQAVERVLQQDPGAGRLLLVVDQFQELYTLCPEPEVRRRFLDELLAAVGSGGGETPSPLCAPACAAGPLYGPGTGPPALCRRSAGSILAPGADDARGVGCGDRTASPKAGSRFRDWLGGTDSGRRRGGAGYSATAGIRANVVVGAAELRLAYPYRVRADRAGGGGAGSIRGQGIWRPG